MKRSVALLALVLIAAGCSSDDAATTTAAPPVTTAAPTTAAPTTTEATTTTTTTTEAPQVARTFVGADGVEVDVSDVSRIVSLNGDLTEILFELGFGANVAAIDVTTTFPEEATALPVVGFGQMLTPEAVLGFGPTLVIGDQQVGPPETIQQLRDAGVPVLILQARGSLQGAIDKINELAEVVGAPDAGIELADRVQLEINDALAAAASAAESPNVAYIYVRGPQTLLLFAGGMPTQAMIEGAGAVDVGAGSGAFGPVPLTPEALIAAAPDVIVLPAAGFGALGGADALLNIPGIAETPAGADRNFLVYEEGYFFGLGPRTGQALAEFVRDLYPELG